MEKKAYIAPTMKVQQVDSEGLLAGSINGSSLHGGATGPSLSKEATFEFDDEDTEALDY